MVPGRTEGVVVPPGRSVDVDEPIDLVVAEALAQVPSGPDPLPRRTGRRRRWLPRDRRGRGQPQRRRGARPPARRRSGRRRRRRREVPDVRTGPAGLGDRADRRVPTGRRRRRRRAAGDARAPGPAARGLVGAARARGDPRPDLPLEPVRRAVRRPPRAGRRPRLQGRVRRAHEPSLPRPARPPRSAAPGVDRHGDHAGGRGRAGRHRARERRAGRSVPLRVELPVAPRRLQPAGDGDPASRLRRPRRLVVPHHGHRGERRRRRPGRGPGREAPDARPDDCPARTTAPPWSPRTSPPWSRRSAPSTRRSAPAARSLSPPSARSPAWPAAACTGPPTCARETRSAPTTSSPSAREPGSTPAELDVLVGRTVRRAVRAGVLVVPDDLAREGGEAP